MNILFYSNTGLTSKQIGLTGEVISNLIEEGHHITYVWCNSVLENCYFNKSRNPIACASCQSRQKAILNQVDTSKVKNISLLPLARKGQFEIPKFKDLEELKAYEFDGINLGTGVASSIISHERSFEFENLKFQDLIEVEMLKSINVLLNFKKLIAEEKPDSIYLFNGRFAESWPVLNLSQHLKVDFNCIESASRFKYNIYKNSLPHSIGYRDIEMKSIWKDGESDPKRTQLSEDWYTSRREKTAVNELVFTGAQKDNLLPPSFDPSKRNIAIMNSSEDEIKVIPEWKTDMYKSQNEAIFQMVEYFKDQKDIHFILRVHPNLGKVNNSQIREIREYSSDNLTKISPESEVDTYYLMDQCEKVITFGSSAGLEATFWGNVSLLYGSSFYMHLDCTYNPKSFDELVRLIEDKELAPKPKESTYPFAYYRSIFGKEPVHFNYDLENPKLSSFKGMQLKQFYLNSIPKLIKYLPRLNHWAKLHKHYFKEKLSLSNFLRYK